MKLKLYTCEDPYLRLRITGTYLGFLLFILGIQGILYIYNTAILSIPHIRLYSILMLVLGIIVILFSLIRCVREIHNTYYDSL